MDGENTTPVQPTEGTEGTEETGTDMPAEGEETATEATPEEGQG